MCLSAAVVWNTSVIDTDFILGTCVVKPDYCRGRDGLGISHSVTHRCSSQKAHVHRVRTEREKEREGDRNRRGMGRWTKVQREKPCVSKNQMIIITWKEFLKRNEEEKEKQRRGAMV